MAPAGGEAINTGVSSQAWQAVKPTRKRGKPPTGRLEGAAAEGLCRPVQETGDKGAVPCNPDIIRLF